MNRIMASGGIGSLGVNLKTLLLQIITFIVVFLLLRKFAFGKIVETLEARRQTIDDGVRLSQAMVLEKAKFEEKVAKALQRAQQEASVIISKGHEEASKILKDAEAQAKHKVDAMMLAAEQQIEDDISRAKQSLKKDILLLVSQATEVIIEQKLDATKDAYLIERALKSHSLKT